MRRLAIIVVLTLAIAGCEIPMYSRSAMVGTYVANYPDAVDVLELRADSTFNQWYFGVQNDSAVTRRATGHWSLVREGIDSYVDFDSLYRGYTGQGNSPEGPTMWRAPAVWRRTHTVISLSSAWDYGFLKVDFDKPPEAVFDSLVAAYKEAYPSVFGPGCS